MKVTPRKDDRWKERKRGREAESEGRRILCGSSITQQRLQDGVALDV